MSLTTNFLAFYTHQGQYSKKHTIITNKCILYNKVADYKVLKKVGESHPLGLTIFSLN